jgi:hypothetical protein
MNCLDPGFTGIFFDSGPLGTRAELRLCGDQGRFRYAEMTFEHQHLNSRQQEPLIKKKEILGCIVYLLGYKGRR